MKFETRTAPSHGGSGDAGTIETVEFIAHSPDRVAEAVVARVSVGVGNTLYYLGHPTILGGRNLLHFPWQDPGEYRENRELGGNPFLYPWANRLDRDGFEFRGQRYDFPDTSGPGRGVDGDQAAAAGTNRPSGDLFWRDGNGLPLHGLLLKSDRWRTIESGPTPDSPAAVHRAEQIFDEAHPAFTCFPFAHRIEIEHRLDFDSERGLRLRVTTRVENRGETALPLSFGYHPYFSYAGFPRDRVRLDLPARFCLDTDDRLLPTGRLILSENRWPSRRDFALADHFFDHGFTGLEREGRRQPTSGDPSPEVSGAATQAASLSPAEFRMTTPGHQISVAFGAGYEVAVIYAPYDPQARRQSTQDFVCIEPMLAPTNALGGAPASLSNAGNHVDWPHLRSLGPGANFLAEFEVIARAR